MTESQIPFLRQLGREDADALLERVRRKSIPRGTEILRRLKMTSKKRDSSVGGPARTGQN